MRRKDWLAIAFGLVALGVCLLIAGGAFGAETAASTLTYDVSSNRPFVVTSIPEKASFVCVEWTSTKDADYRPSKCLNFSAGTLREWRTDWTMIDCTIDDIFGATEPPICATGVWEVRAYTVTDDAEKVYSNMIHASREN